MTISGHRHRIPDSEMLEATYLDGCYVRQMRLSDECWIYVAPESARPAATVPDSPEALTLLDSLPIDDEAEPVFLRRS